MKPVTIRYPLPRPPTPVEWRHVWHLTGIPPATSRRKGCWAIQTPPDRYDAVVSFLQDISESLGLAPSLPINYIDFSDK